ncbi:hypothetical protein BC938DRAFT_472116 [Jimgerdemannia flammicorona]|uniref:Protein UNC80 C-terminal domain-containing protein n=1 Tax=Jimgerdemannia flammicorona TaxID=994334 RepID=A0A433Q6S5_9FUNG|nr:hypothetical protein BC938DRAFT_472116 [Jimgerdemannia flammicorona]
MASLQKLASLFGHRFNILTQDYIPDNSITGRRLFRTGAVVIPFVATDLGTNKFTLDEPRWMAKLKNAGAFPIEMKKQIQELGWNEDDQVEEHDQLRRELTPLSLLPTFYLGEEDENAAEDQNAGTHSSAMAAAISALNARKRTATVPSLSLASLGMIDLLNDVHGGVFNTVRELVSYILRDDPALFLRVFLGDIGKAEFELERQKELLTRLRYLVAMQSKFPPNFTHMLFNHLAGLLKWYARGSKEGGLTLMLHAHPLLSELVLSTNELSVRDLRKNKIEYLLCSTGQFWFTDGQPLTMFPRSLSNPTRVFEVIDVPLQLFEVAMLRISHLHFLTNYISRYPREVYAVKKTFQEYEPTPMVGTDSVMNNPPDWSDDVYLPDLSDRNNVGNIDGKLIPSRRGQDTCMLSALRARVWLNFVDTLLTGLNKNYNDRSDLERILRGVNQVILSHRRDFELIGKALILYVRVVARFRRMFASNRGYALFLPAVFRIFCESENISAVRDAIISTFSRFFAIHEEAFVFQALGSIIPLALKAYQKSNELGAWMSENLYHLIKTLNQPTSFGSSIDVLGLQLQIELDDRAVAMQEQEEAAHRTTATPLSDKLLKPLTPLTKAAAVPVAALLSMPTSDKTFPLEDSVKLFLTIIAHDTGSTRAEQFVKMLRHLLPSFMRERSQSVRDLLDQGVVALIDVFWKFSKTAKPTMTNTTSALPDSNMMDGTLGGGARAESTQQAYGKQWSQNNRLTIKQEFVRLVQTYCKNGGSLSDVYHDRMAQIIRNVVKDYATRRIVCPTKFIKDYVTDVIPSISDLSDGRKAMVFLLSHIQLLYRAQWKHIDAADMFEGFAIVMERSHGRAVLTFEVAHILKNRFVEVGLSIAVRSDWEDEGLRQQRFCNSLVRLMVSLMEHTPLDVVAEIERLPPTAPLIAYIVTPICMQYNLRSEYRSVLTLAENLRSDPTNNWMRLLAYITRACSKASLIRAKENGHISLLGQSGNGELETPTPDKQKRISVQPTTVASAMFVMSFTALKVVLVRGSKSLDKSKGAWLHVANFAKSSLLMGQNLNILRGLPSSPSANNRVSLQEHDYFTSSPGAFEPRRGSSLQQAGAASVFSTPIDFATWSFLELVISYKSPLILYMRTFIHQKLHDGGAQNRLSTLPESPRTRGGSIAVPNVPSSPTEISRRSKWKSWGGPAVMDQSPQNGVSSPVKATPMSAVSSPSSPAAGLGLNVPISPSPTTSRMNDQPIAAEANHIRGSSLVDSNHGRTSSLANTRTSSLADHNHIRSSSLAVSTRTTSTQHLKQQAQVQNLYLETIKSLESVQTSLGYRIGGLQGRMMLRPWGYHQAMDKLVKEWRMILQSYPDIFVIVDKQVEVVEGLV